MKAYDSTEGKLKVLGFIGSVIVGISGAAVGTWRTLKEVDKIHENKPTVIEEPTEDKTETTE